MITVAALSPSLDVTYLLDSFQLGRIHRPREVHRVAGGKPLNLARAAASLHAHVSTVAVLGGATGKEIEEQLGRADIALRLVASDIQTRTCISVASADRPGLTEIYEHTPPLSADVWQRFRTELGSELTGRDGWLVINGSPPAGLDPGSLAELVGLAHRTGARVAADVSGPPLAAVLSARPEVVKINRSEAAELLAGAAMEHLAAESTDDVTAMAQAIAGQTSGTVIVTDGKDGAVCCAPDAPALRAQLPVDVVGSYPVGSGDCFLAGLLTALDDGADIAAALRCASGAGAANALLPGAGNFEPATARQIAGRAAVDQC